MNEDRLFQTRSFLVSEVDLVEYVNEFYRYFENGFVFEYFLKYFLERLDLDEVSVTQRTRDGGIDLKAVRLGVGSFNQNDLVNYYIQAKKYNPNSVISVGKIRELRGTLPAGYRGIFITTASFSGAAIREAEMDPSRLIILIDGRKLVQTCIEHGIGFVFVPRFSSDSLDRIMNDDSSNENELFGDSASDLVVNKNITFNDIRSRIMSIPREIFDKLDSDVHRMNVVINDQNYELSINHDRKFFAGVTSIYRELNLISDDGIFHPAMSIWKYSDDKLYIKIEV